MNQYHAIRDSDPRVANMCCRILPPLPGSNIDQMCIQERGHDEGRHENGDGTVKPWPERIPAAIAKAEELLSGQRRIFRSEGRNIVSVPLGFTAGEVALADDLAEAWDYMCHQNGLHEEGALPISDEAVPPSLIAYCEKIEGLSHDEKN